MNNVIDMHLYKKRKYLKTSIKELRELVITLRTVIKSLTKFNKYRRIQDEIVEVDQLIKEVLSSLDKKTKELELVNENIYLE